MRCLLTMLNADSQMHVYSQLYGGTFLKKYIIATLEILICTMKI